MKSYIITLLVFASGLGLTSIHAQEKADLPTKPISRTGSPSLYIVVEGDTPESVATKILGGSDFTDELLSYNRIKDRNLQPGTTLVIPGRERDTALSGLWQSKDTRDAAVDAGAEKFAAKELKQADIVFNGGSQAFKSADYERAGALSQHALKLFNRAREVADANALKDNLARVTKLNGVLRYSTDGGVNWKKVEEGEQIPVNSSLRSDANSRAEIQLPDTSTFVVNELSDVTFKVMNEDLRNGRMDTQLEISTGEIFGNIKPKKKNGSKFYIKNGRTTIVIRGTTVRTNRDDKGTLRSMTLTGNTELVTDNGEPVALNAGFGTLAELNKAPLPPIELLPPPAVVYPDKDVVTTSTQVINFQWQKVRSNKLKHYLIEIARDPLFLDLAFSATSKDTSIDSSPLPAGIYHWRISSFDKIELQGPVSTPVKFIVEPQLHVTLLTNKTPVEKDGLIWLPPETVIQAEPLDPKDTSVTDIAYSVNNSDYKSYPKGIVLKGEGEFQVSVKGRGATNNEGKTFNRVYRIDATGPDIAFRIGEVMTDPVVGEARPLTLELKDDLEISAIQLSINEGKPTPYSGQILLSTSQEYEIRVSATDIFGNASTRGTIVNRLRKPEKKPDFEPNL